MACSTGDRSNERDFNQIISHYNHNFIVVLSYTPNPSLQSLKRPSIAQCFDMSNFKDEILYQWGVKRIGE